MFGISAFPIWSIKLFHWNMPKHTCTILRRLFSPTWQEAATGIEWDYAMTKSKNYHESELIDNLTGCNCFTSISCFYRLSEVVRFPNTISPNKKALVFGCTLRFVRRHKINVSFVRVYCENPFSDVAFRVYCATYKEKETLKIYIFIYSVPINFGLIINWL